MQGTWPSTVDGVVTISFAKASPGRWRNRPDAAGTRLIAAMRSKAHLSLGGSWPATYISDPGASQPILFAP
jgi:hypothetical protein